jgi:hypothetical protein
VLGGRDERQRRGGHDVGDGRQLLGCGLGGGDEAGDHLGGGRQQQPAPDDLGQRVQADLEAGDDAEVAAAAADGPEQLRMRLVIHAQELAVGGHHLGGQQVVDGQPVLADQVADPPARVRPPMPTEAVSPNPVARPRSAAAVV